MPTKSQPIGVCFACGASGERVIRGRCGACGALLNGPEALAVRQADIAIATLQRRYDDLAGEWQQWAHYRSYYVEAMRRTAVPSAVEAAPAAMPGQQAVVPDPTPVVEAAFASPTVPDAVAPAVVASPVPTVTSATASPEGHATLETQPPPRVSKASAAREALTAPALLGVAGASLLVAAAIVFVALAWTSFSPATRGTVVLAVGVMVGALAVWVKRLGLTASAGAIGVVSMGFAGVASVGYFRDSGALGSFDTAAALLVAAAAGLVLSRFSIPWVGSAAALSMAGSVVGFTVAATTTAGRADAHTPGIGAMPVWIVVGTAGASALAASHRLWRWNVAKVIVRWASVVWLTLVGLSVPAWIWFGDGKTLDALLGLVPMLALALLATRWQLLATGPAALVPTLMAPALAATLGAGAWPQAAASVAVVTCLLSLGRWLPRRVLRPLFIGVSPAYAVVAVASATYSVAITVARVVAGTYVPDTQMWAGVAALIAGLAVAVLRVWQLEWTLLKAATVVGAAMVAVGAGITAFGIAELTGPPLYHSSVAVAMTLAGLAAMTRVWWERPARLVSELGALAFLITAAVHADWAAVIAEANVVLAVVIGAAPLAIFALRSNRAPWWTLPYLSAGVTALGASIAARYGAETALVAAVAVVTACAIAWTGWRAPRRLHAPIVVGLTPAAALGVAAAVGTVAGGSGALLSGDTTHTGSAWWSVAVLALAVAIASAPRWHVPQPARVIVPSVGAATLVIAAVGIALNAANVWGAGVLGSASAAVLVGALVALPGMLMWREERAAVVNGVASAALATLAGVSALGQVASSADPLWLPLVVALAAASAFAIGAKWWPKVALAPAVFLATGIGYALAARSEGAIAAVGIAAVLAAATVWLPLSIGHRRLAAIGAAPAFALGLLTSAAAVYASVLSVINAPTVGSEFLLLWWVLLALVATIAALLAVPRLAKGSERDLAAVVSAAGWVLAPLALGLSVTLTAIIGGDNATSWRNASVAAVAGIIAAVVTALGIAWAYSSYVRAPLASRDTRRLVRIGATGWVALVALIAAWGVYSGGLLWQAGAIALALALAGLLAAARSWPRAALAPAATLATAVPLVFFGDGASTGAWVIPLAAAVAALLAWAERVPGIARRMGGVFPGGFGPLALGAIPAAVAALPLALTGAVRAIGSLIRHVTSDASDAIDLRYAVTLLALVLGALSVKRLSRFAAIITSIALTVALASVDAVWAAVVLMVVEGALILAYRRVRSSARAAAIAGAGAVLWASHEWLVLAAAATLLGLLAVVVVKRRGTHSPVLAVVVAPLAAALGAFSLGHGTGLDWAASLAGPAAATALVAVGALMWSRVPAVSARALPWVLAAAPIVIAVASSSLASAGVVLLIASVAWFALMAKEVQGALWYGALFASAGVAIIMMGAEVAALEAYTLTPALCAFYAGVRWMRSNPAVSSLSALSPGLAMGLVPSYIALLREPDNLARTAWLTIVMVALAVLGMQRRWFAPVVATATTAVIVAVLQVVVGSNLVFRLIAFLVVGTLLLVAASWFDKIKALR